MRTTTAAACCSLLLAAVAPWTAAQRDAAEDPAAFNYRGSKPNIIIVYADDLGSGDLGFYGHPTSSTPNLNTFIMEGARLTQYYSPAAICSPSRGSLVSLLATLCDFATFFVSTRHQTTYFEVLILVFIVILCFFSSQSPFLVI